MLGNIRNRRNGIRRGNHHSVRREASTGSFMYLHVKKEKRFGREEVVRRAGREEPLFSPLNAEGKRSRSLPSPLDQVGWREMLRNMEMREQKGEMERKNEDPSVGG
jgi:hypothetical protein